jgi:hypothetical protein
VTGAESTSAQQIVRGTAEVAAEDAAVRVAQPAERHRGEQEAVGGDQAAVGLGEREAADDQQPGEGRQPEERPRPLARDEDGRQGGGSGQRRDEDRAVGRLARGQREAGEEREADDDTARDEREALELMAARQRRADRGEVGAGEGRRDGGAREGDEPRIEVLDRELRRREREGEGHDAGEAEEQTTSGRHPPRPRSVTVGPHG